MGVVSYLMVLEVHFKGIWIAYLIYYGSMVGLGLYEGLCESGIYWAVKGAFMNDV